MRLQQPFDDHRQPRLLQRLTGGRRARVFAVVNVPGRQAPLAALRLHRAAHQQHPPILDHQHTDADLGIGEVNVAAGGAGAARPVNHAARHERRGAAGTEGQPGGGAIE